MTNYELLLKDTIYLVVDEKLCSMKKINCMMIVSLRQNLSLNEIVEMKRSNMIDNKWTKQHV